MIGVCFGHQLIARALGGEVSKYDGGFGTGIRASRVLDDEMKPYFPQGKMHLLYSHHDQVMRLPQGATRCAISDFCENESFRMGTQVITFQGHPEFTVAYSRHLLTNCSDDIDEQVRLAGLQSLDRLQPQGNEAARFALDLLLK